MKTNIRPLVDLSREIIEKKTNGNFNKKQWSEEYKKEFNLFFKENKCPQCENEEIETTENYCKICGLELIELNAIKIKGEYNDK